MAKLGILTLRGVSGKKYEFNVYDAKVDWQEDIACVYYVSKREVGSDKTGSHTAIYIGETGDLKTRHENHHRQQCFERHGYNCISVHLEPDQSTRLAIETDLIKAYDPPCNRQ